MSLKPNHLICTGSGTEPQVPAKPSPRPDGCTEPKWGPGPKAWENFLFPKATSVCPGPFPASEEPTGRRCRGDLRAVPLLLPSQVSLPNGKRGTASD